MSPKFVNALFSKNIKAENLNKHLIFGLTTGEVNYKSSKEDCFFLYLKCKFQTSNASIICLPAFEAFKSTSAAFDLDTYSLDVYLARNSQNGSACNKFGPHS